MTVRRALRISGTSQTVLTEGQFDAELDLQQAFVERTELLPGEDLGLGTLVAVAWELDMGAGGMDLLAVDGAGRVVIVEFKKGTENPDVRTVVAQMLDYGSALWRTTLDELGRRCADNGSYTLIAPESDLVAHVQERLVELGEQAPDADALARGVDDNLRDGSFVFAYVARDLDARTRRVLTYLADGAGLAMFAVEVDNFRTADRTETVLVPRVAFVPANIIERRTAAPLEDPATDRLLELIKPIAESASAAAKRADNGWLWPTVGIGVYRSSSGLSVDVANLRARVGDERVTEVATAFAALLGRKAMPPQWWSIAPSAVVNAWETSGRVLVTALFAA